MVITTSEPQTHRRIGAGSFPALLLNADYRPVGVYPLKTLHWQESLRAMMANRVDVVEEHPYEARSAGGRGFMLPSVVALRRFRPMDRHVAFTRLGVYLRDRFRCGYCGGKFGMRDLTFDHVVPYSKGGKTSWTNIVTACNPCNLAKGDKSPERAGMTLRCELYRPTKGRLNDIARDFPPPLAKLHRAWLPYLGIEEVEGMVTATENLLARAAAGMQEATNPAFPPGMTEDDYWNAELDEA